MEDIKLLINILSREEQNDLYSWLCDKLDMGYIDQKSLDYLEDMSRNHPG